MIHTFSNVFYVFLNAFLNALYVLNVFVNVNDRVYDDDDDDVCVCVYVFYVFYVYRGHNYDCVLIHKQLMKDVHVANDDIDLEYHIYHWYLLSHNLELIVFVVHLFHHHRHLDECQVCQLGLMGMIF